MKYEVVANNERFVYEAEQEVDNEQIALLKKSMDTIYDPMVELKGLEEQEEIARCQITQMFEKANKEYGLKSIKGKYINVTFIKESKGETTFEKVINPDKVKEIMEEFGIKEEKYMDVVPKTTGKRKASVKIGVH